MMWISNEEYEKNRRRRAAARRYYIKRLVREKLLNAHAIAKGTGLSPSVVRRFLKGGDVYTRTYDKIRLFCERSERYERPKSKPKR